MRVTIAPALDPVTGAARTAELEQCCTSAETEEDFAAAHEALQVHLESMSERTHDLVDAEPTCIHQVIDVWSGSRCRHCGGHTVTF